MLIEQYSWIKRAWVPWPHMYSSNWMFSLLGKDSTGLLFTAKILQEAMYFIYPNLGQITYKI